MNQDIEFFSSTHQYYHKGKELISVTTAFERVGITDFEKVPFEVLEPARIEGDRVHEIAALFGGGVLDVSSVDQSLLGYFEAIKKFYSENVKRAIAIEAKIACVPIGYAGTVDLIYVNHQDKLILDDFKTIKKVHPSWKWQTAAYAYAFEKSEKVSVDGRGSVQLGKDGNYYRDPHTNRLKKDFDEFVTILRCANLKITNKIK